MAEWFSEGRKLMNAIRLSVRLHSAKPRISMAEWNFQGAHLVTVTRCTTVEDEVSIEAHFPPVFIGECHKLISQ
jgi:hypothetical protein